VSNERPNAPGGSNNPLYVVFSGDSTSFGIVNAALAAADAAIDVNGQSLTGVDDLEAGGDATVGGTLEVTGASTLTGDVGMTGAATVGTTLGVTGASTLTGGAGVGGALAASAILGATSTTKGFLFPRRTEVQRDAIAAPAAGLVVYNTTSNKLNLRVAAGWEVITSA
jgi:hypothetical protein